MKKNILHGNNAKIEPLDNSIIPLYLTNVITPKKEQKNNTAPQPIEQNVLLGKKYVDENHK